MQSSEDSDVFLGAEAKPLPISVNIGACHQFRVYNHNPFPMEVTDSLVYVESGVGLVLTPQNSSSACFKWSPGRLGVLPKDKKTRFVETAVSMDPNSNSSGEQLVVTITFQRVALPKKRVAVSKVVDISVIVSVPIE
jgi:hypothetical protein